MKILPLPLPRLDAGVFLQMAPTVVVELRDQLVPPEVEKLRFPLKHRVFPKQAVDGGVVLPWLRIDRHFQYLK